MKTSQAGLEAIKDYIGTKHTPGVSDDQADDALHAELNEFEDTVNDLVTVELTQGQFDALVSLVSFLKRVDFADSSLLRFLNRGDYLRAANEFPRYTIEGGYVQPVLVKRRYAERARFMETIT